MDQPVVERRDTGLAERWRVVDPLLRCLISKKKLSEDTILTILGTTLRKASDYLFTQTIMLARIQEDGKRLRLTNVYFSPALYQHDKGLRKRYMDRTEELKSSSYLMSEGTEVWQVMQSKELIPFRAFVSGNAPEDPVLMAPGLHVESVLAAPLRASGDTLGAIVAINKCREFPQVIEFTSEDGLMLMDVAEFSALVLERIKDPKKSLDPVSRARYGARLARTDFVRLRRGFPMDEEFIRKIGEERIQRYEILPLERLNDRQVRAALTDPLDFQATGDFEVATGYSIAEKIVTTPEDIRGALDRIFPKATEVQKALEKVSEEFGLDEFSEEMDFQDEVNEYSAPIVKLSNRIIEDAYHLGASDIHVEPQDKNVVIRYRVDGVCHVKLILPSKAHRPLITRLKIMSELDIAERRLPQDGRLPFVKFNSDVDIDLRVSVVPAKHGESIVMRILDKTKPALPLNTLGFSNLNLERYREDIRSPYGMILHCGPTGSGKSMTLYSALNEINQPDVKIVTAEDPIEYTLPGIIQVQIRHAIGLTFAAALRCFLRQDPDIILVGEIRDRETAQIAVEAALTGHILFSTLHTNDAASAVTRLSEIGIEPFLIANSVISVCSQRLIRKLCTCAVPGSPTEEQHALLEGAGISGLSRELMQPKGCDSCDKTGYRGRTGIHELLQVDSEMRRLIIEGDSSDRMKKAAREAGMKTLFEDAILKVRERVTSLNEALRVVQPDSEE